MRRAEVGLEALEKTLGFHFQDPALLQRALVHSSYLNENPDFPLGSNERLEFLGDAILDFLVGEFLYRRYPALDEGELTQLRAALVRRETLASFAARLELGKYLCLSRGEAQSGGRHREAILCAVFEALVGALFLDQGLEATRSFVLPLVEVEAVHILAEDLHLDPKSLLQELAQERLHRPPDYRIVEESGPDHAKLFTVQVLLDGTVYGQGEGNSKQAAEEAAARIALTRLKKHLGKAPAPE